MSDDITNTESTLLALSATEANKTTSPGVYPGTPDAETGPEDVSDRQGGKGNREARYRTERNEAREQLATATARIETLQRAEVERLAAEHLAVPGDFWLSENSVAD